MLDTHLGPGFRLFEVKICHSPLDIERRLNIAHPRLPFRNVLFANAQPCVDLLGLLRLKHGADRVAENAVWSYLNPLPECLPIEKLLSFFNERVDAIYVDDVQIVVPRTPWSE